MCSIQFETEPGSGERERERDRERQRELSLGIGLFDASISIISDHLSIQYILAWSWSALSYDPNLCSWRWSLFRSKTLNRSLALRSASILPSLPSLFHLRDFSVTGPKAGQLVSTTHIDCELVIPARVSVQGLEETHRSTVRRHYVHHVNFIFFPMDSMILSLTPLILQACKQFSIKFSTNRGAGARNLCNAAKTSSSGTRLHNLYIM